MSSLTNNVEDEKKKPKEFGIKKVLSIFAVPNSGLLQFSYYNQSIKLLRLLTAKK